MRIFCIIKFNTELNNISWEDNDIEYFIRLNEGELQAFCSDEGEVFVETYIQDKNETDGSNHMLEINYVLPKIIKQVYENKTQEKTS